MEISSTLPSDSWLLSNPFHPDFRSVNPFQATGINPFSNPFRVNDGAQLPEARDDIGVPSETPEKITNPFEPGFVFNPFLPGSIVAPRKEARSRFGTIRRRIVSVFHRLIRQAQVNY